MTEHRRWSRDLLRAELADRIFDFLADRGFGEVTVDEAARAGGISRATFFRYFGSKEEVVVAAIQRPGAKVPELIRSTPVPRGTDAWGLLRLAHEPVVSHAAANRARLAARVRMVMEHASLRTHFAASKFERDRDVAAALATRLAQPDRAAAIAAAGLALVDLTWRHWADSEDAAFGDLLDHALGSLAAGSAALKDDAASTSAASDAPR